MDENTARRAAVEFLGGQVQESGFRVGVPISCRRRVGVPGSCRCPRRVRRGLDATASVGVPYDVRVRESSPGGSHGTPLGRTAPDLRRSCQFSKSPARMSEVACTSHPSGKGPGREVRAGTLVHGPVRAVLNDRYAVSARRRTAPTNWCAPNSGERRIRAGRVQVESTSPPLKSFRIANASMNGAPGAHRV
jgi:hypothetical protein